MGTGRRIISHVIGLQSAWREIPAWLFGRRIRHRVTGNSMEPVLKSGDTVFINRMDHADKVSHNNFQSGNLVVLSHPHQSEQLIIKQISDIRTTANAQQHATMQLFVTGMRPEASTDSRVFGWVDAIHICGKVTYILSA